MTRGQLLQRLQTLNMNLNCRDLCQQAMTLKYTKLAVRYLYPIEDSIENLFNQIELTNELKDLR